MATVNQNIAINVNRYRIVTGLTQKELAARAGVAVSTVQRVERHGDVGQKSLTKLARALRLDDTALEQVPSPQVVVQEDGATKRRKRAA